MREQGLDLICLGRAAVDLYGEQIGSPLEDMQTFAKYVGGSAANIAVGTARLGLKSAMLTRVGDEHMGRFVRSTLQAEGVDVSCVNSDQTRLTGLVLLGIRDKETFPLIFYRERCADMGLCVDDIDPAFIGSARALLVTGTHFSTASVDAASRAAMRYAKAAGGRVILDIDFRPVLWGLTGHGLGEERFVASDQVTDHIQSIVAECDLIVGTEEEMHIAGGTTNTLDALRTLRTFTNATLVLKRGAYGCAVFPADIPNQVDDAVSYPGFSVEVLNVLGAGDAFMSGFLSGWLEDAPLAECCRLANACGALVVARHGCAPAMPSRSELEVFLSRSKAISRPLQDATLSHLHRASTRQRSWPEVCVFALDNRLHMEKLAHAAGRDLQDLRVLKRLLAIACERVMQSRGENGGLGVIIDEQYGESALNALTGRGWWMSRPIERSGVTPLEFVGGPNVGLTLRTWPQEHVIKCLAYMHPAMAPETLRQQVVRVKQLHEACVGTDHELLLELLPPSELRYDSRSIPRLMDTLYDEGVMPDWWKLPASDKPEAWEHIQDTITRRDPYCRGVLLLGGGQDDHALAQAFAVAKNATIVKGFAVGRTIFDAPSQAWLTGAIDDNTVIEQVAERFVHLIHLWRQH